MSSLCNWEFEAGNFISVVYEIGSLKQGLSIRGTLRGM